MTLHRRRGTVEAGQYYRVCSSFHWCLCLVWLNEKIWFGCRIYFSHWYIFSRLDLLTTILWFCPHHFLGGCCIVAWPGNHLGMCCNFSFRWIFDFQVHGRTIFYGIEFSGFRLACTLFPLDFSTRRFSSRQVSSGLTSDFGFVALLCLKSELVWACRFSWMSLYQKFEFWRRRVKALFLSILARLSLRCSCGRNWFWGVAIPEVWTLVLRRCYACRSAWSTNS